MTIIYVVCYCHEHLKNLALTEQTFALFFSGFTGIDKTTLNTLLMQRLKSSTATVFFLNNQPTNKGCGTGDVYTFTLTIS